MAKYLAAGLGLAMIVMSGAAGASITGSGACRGLQIHASWLDWGTGMVSINARNHTGDSPDVRNEDITFQVRYEGASQTGASPTSEPATLIAGQEGNVEVFNWESVTGKSPQSFDGYGLIKAGRFSLVNCKRR